MNSAFFFFTTTETATDTANVTIARQHDAPPHPLETAAVTQAGDANDNPTTNKDKIWDALPPYRQYKSLACANVYLDDFILLLQGGNSKRQKMTRHLFVTINKILCTNAP